MSIDGDFLRSVEVRSEDAESTTASLWTKTSLNEGQIVGLIDKIFVELLKKFMSSILWYHDEDDDVEGGLDLYPKLDNKI